ncbi:hypothetical protein L2089_08050 [Paenibacillus hunanensis]|uniref:hypothetical protein n=1 Tax=Paenibacillus hunanensis TaxID=539262 RepID=UPI002026326D|nr:hypothetical protein [Paenibacillus hunanensis]MCL9660633.1 hypothetical protein [Paenibacillus hunanensis]
MMNFHLKKFVSSVMVKIILMVMVSLLGKTFFPQLYSIVFSSMFWVIYIVLISLIGFFNYLNIKEFANDMEHIYNTKMENMSYAKFEKYATQSEYFAKIHKTKLDIFKALSPIPLIVFLLGFYTGNNFNSNNKINLFHNEFLLSDIFMYFGIGISIFYFYFMYSSFSSYKKNIIRAMHYKSEAIMETAKKEEANDN